MGLFGDREALRLARQAQDDTNKSNTVIAIGLAKLEAHILTCDNRAKDLQQELQRDRVALQEWRYGLGQRLDAQDRMTRQVALLVIGVLCSIIVTAGGFLIPHIVTFSK